jgi:predicted RNA methylase
MLPLFPYKRGVSMHDIHVTEEGKYSYTKREDGDRTIQFLKRYIPSLHTRTILDGTGNIGGDTILFGLNFYTVHSIELDPDNFKALTHNVNLYKLKNVHLHEGDTTELYKDYPSDILYLDPPWGGPDYKEKKELDLWLGSHRLDIFLRDSVLSKEALWKPQWIVLKLPFNYKWDRLEMLEGIEAMHTLRIRNYRIVIMKGGEGKKKSKTRRAKRVHST